MNLYDILQVYTQNAEGSLTSNNNPTDGSQHMSTTKYVATAKKTTRILSNFKGSCGEGKLCDAQLTKR